jgi:hypothetical protein
MRLAATIVLFLASFALPAFAQSDLVAPAECEGAQDFYDNLDPDNVVMISTSTAVSGGRVSVRLGAVQTLRDFAIELAEREHPECVAVALDWYVEGIGNLATALETLVDGEAAQFAIQFTKVGQLIGQWRGYMAAIGVEIVPGGTATQYR